MSIGEADLLSLPLELRLIIYGFCGCHCKDKHKNHLLYISSGQKRTEIKVELGSIFTPRLACRELHTEINKFVCHFTFGFITTTHFRNAQGDGRESTKSPTRAPADDLRLLQA